MVSGAEMTMLKRMLVDAVGPLATGVMLEPEFSIPQVSVALPPTVGFFAALEAQGYLDEPGAAATTILDGWSVEQAVASGAAVAKMLLPYHPDRPLAAEQRAVARSTVTECRRLGISVVLEPLFYGLDDPSDRRRVVLQTARDFGGLAPDLMKLPFPVDPDAVPAVDQQRAACAAISDELAMPWALLSGGGSFKSFLDQLVVAMDGGCSGFMVGRALWGDAVTAAPEERQELMETLVRGRMMSLRAAIGL